MAPGFLNYVGHTIFRFGGGGDGNGKSGATEDDEPLRLGHSGEPLYTTLGGHPVSDDNNRYSFPSISHDIWQARV